MLYSQNGLQRVLSYGLVALYSDLYRLYIRWLSNGNSYFRSFYHFMVFIHMCSSYVMDEKLFRKWRFQSRNKVYRWYDVTNMTNLKLFAVLSL